MKKITLFSCFFAVLFFGAALFGAEPKYVFLFIGDGMGKPHVDLARQQFGKLNMDRLPVRGSVSTVNAEGKTTDSAASGTAFACGVKTKNGRLGIDKDGKSVDSCAVLAKRQGRRVAILTTVGLNNATPAAFYAHVTSRKETQKIILQFPDSQIDILCGSGIDGMRKDVNQEDFLNGKAYQAGSTEGDASGLSAKVRMIARDDKPFFALKQLESPVLVYSRGIDRLDSYVQKSVELMQECPNGFFLMAEGGRIDHGGHSRNGQYMLDELRKFDLAIGVALEFFARHPTETLIIVSADHHTGKFTITGTPSSDYAKRKITVAEKDTLPSLEAKLSAVGIDCTEEEKAELQKVLSQKAVKKADVEQAVRRIVDARSGISWESGSHTTDEVYLFAIGNGAERFAGQQQNSDVGRKLKQIFETPAP